jgi:hypothetical protein
MKYDLKEFAVVATAATGAFAWFTTPILKYAPALWLYTSGSALILGLFFIWFRAELSGVDLSRPTARMLRIGSWLFGIGSLG